MLHAITCHFNPHGYLRPIQNYWRFRAALSPVVPLHTIELSFTGRFEIEDALHVLGGSENLLWQKERLLNRLVETLPSDVDRIAWIDADLLFGNAHWAEEAEAALDATPVAQLFETAQFLDQHGRVIRSRKSFATVIRGQQDDVSSPGFAWAARRELFPLIDIAICGGGDKLMAEAWRGNYQATSARMNKAWVKVWIEQSQRQRELVRGRIGHVRGDVFHCWHGRMDNRRYEDRWQYLTDHSYDPTKDIAIDDNGLWRWSSDKPQMHAQVAGYFKQRREDG